MLEKLTPEQEQLIYTVRDEYIDRFFSLEFDPEACIKLYNYIYKDISKQPEPEIVICRSPFEAKCAALLSHYKYPDAPQRQHQRHLQQIQEMTMDERKELVKECEARSDYEESLFQFAFYGDCSNYNWVAYYDYFTRIDMLHEPMFENYRDFLVAANPFMTLQFEDVVFVSMPPTRLARDPQDRLHANDSAAMKFRDGFELYYIHGMRLTKEQFDTFFGETADPQLSDLFEITNAEIRTAILMEHLPLLIKQNKDIKLIDEDFEWIHKYETVRNPKNINEMVQRSVSKRKAPRRLYSFEYMDRTHHVIQVTDHSVDKPVVILTPNDIDTVKESVKWVNWGLEDFAVET